MKAHFMSSVIKVFSISVIILASGYGNTSAMAEGSSVLKGRISDMEGQAVEGAMVFIYNSVDVKRSADFISAPTDKDGLFRIVLPVGSYWLVARLKMTEGYGPLMPGDKHSGDPGEIEITPDSEASMDFIVADLKEAIKMKRENMERPFKISGRIIDEKGSPVMTAYAIANRKDQVSSYPDYLSAWVDKDGRYMMYIPRGSYYIGGAAAFPPGKNYFINQEITVDADRLDMDIVWVK